MAPDSSSFSDIANVPLQQVVIALLLVKSKPTGLSCQEYLAQLLSCIRAGVRSDPSTTAHHHVDTTAFWRDAYTKSQETEIALKARISELEMREKALLESGSGNPATTVSPRKRKRGTAEGGETSSSKSQRRPKVIPNVPTVDKQDSVLESLMNEVEGIGSDTVGRTFLSHFYLLQQSLSEKDLVPEEIATTLRHLSSDISQLVSAVQLSEKFEDATTTSVRISRTKKEEKNASPVQAKLEKEIETRMLAIGRTFPYLLKCLHRLSEAPDGLVTRSRVVYDYIKLFDHILEHICELAATAHSRKRLVETRAKKRQKGLEKKQPTAALSAESPPRSKNIMSLCDFALILMASLDTTKPTHRDILEGFQYFLLRRVGQGLKKFVFGFEDHGIWQRYESNGDQIEQQASTEDQGREDEEALQARAPYLISILDRAQVLKSQHIQLAINDSNKDRATSPSASIANLSGTAHTKLQHTLLKAVFGDRASVKFEPALRPPQLPPNESISDVDIGIWSPEIKDWYKHEVWRIVGWDVLESHIQWDNGTSNEGE